MQIYFTGCAGDVTMGKYNDGSLEPRAELTASAGRDGGLPGGHRFAPSARPAGKWCRCGCRREPMARTTRSRTASRCATRKATADARQRAASRLAFLEGPTNRSP